MKNKFFLFYHVSLLQSTHSEIYRDISPSRKQDKKEEGSAAPLFFLILFFPARLYSTSMILIWLAVKPATSVTMSTMRAVSASVMPPSGAATARLTLSSPMKATQSV
mgnify:CR=1 FL=1